MVTAPVNEAARALPPLTVLYDGGCPLCRRETGLCRGLQANTPLCVADVSDAAVPLVPGNMRAQSLARGNVRGRDGALLSGAPAFRALWAALPGWRLPDMPDRARPRPTARDQVRATTRPGELDPLRSPPLLCTEPVRAAGPAQPGASATAGRGPTAA